MAYAITANTKKVTEFAGDYKIVTLKVTPDAATGNVVFSDVTTIIAIAGFGFAGDLTANCYTMQAAINGSTANQIDFKLWKAGGTAADTAYVAFWVTVIGN